MGEGRVYAGECFLKLEIRQWKCPEVRKGGFIE
jgi:hypothetical protein